jgi:sugar lactone lactonase YvrE
VVVGPDGAYYVGTLTGGPFPAGGASVYRVVPGEAPQVYATGFSAIMDIGFGPDGTLFVAELVHDGLLPVFMGEAPPIGAIMSVPSGGGEPSLVATGEALMAPGGLTVAGDGSIYVTTKTIMPGTGAVVKVTP